MKKFRLERRKISVRAILFSLFGFLIGQQYKNFRNQIHPRKHRSPRQSLHRLVSINFSVLGDEAAEEFGGHHQADDCETDDEGEDCVEEQADYGGEAGGVKDFVAELDDGEVA